MRKDECYYDINVLESEIKENEFDGFSHRNRRFDIKVIEDSVLDEAPN